MTSTHSGGVCETTVPIVAPNNIASLEENFTVDELSQVDQLSQNISPENLYLQIENARSLVESDVFFESDTNSSETLSNIEDTSMTHEDISQTSNSTSPKLQVACSSSPEKESRNTPVGLHSYAKKLHHPTTENNIRSNAQDIISGENVGVETASCTDRAVSSNTEINISATKSVMLKNEIEHDGEVKVISVPVMIDVASEDAPKTASQTCQVISKEYRALNTRKGIAEKTDILQANITRKSDSDSPVTGLSLKMFVNQQGKPLFCSVPGKDTEPGAPYINLTMNGTRYNFAFTDCKLASKYGITPNDRIYILTQGQNIPCSSTKVSPTTSSDINNENESVYPVKLFKNICAAKCGPAHIESDRSDRETVKADIIDASEISDSTTDHAPKSASVLLKQVAEKSKMASIIIPVGKSVPSTLQSTKPFVVPQYLSHTIKKDVHVPKTTEDVTHPVTTIIMPIYYSNITTTMTQSLPSMQRADEPVSIGQLSGSCSILPSVITPGWPNTPNVRSILSSSIQDRSTIGSKYVFGSMKPAAPSVSTQSFSTIRTSTPLISSTVSGSMTTSIPVITSKHSGAINPTVPVVSKAPTGSVMPVVPAVSSIFLRPNAPSVSIGSTLLSVSSSQNISVVSSMLSSSPKTPMPVSIASSFSIGSTIVPSVFTPSVPFGVIPAQTVAPQTTRLLNLHSVVPLSQNVTIPAMTPFLGCSTNTMITGSVQFAQPSINNNVISVTSAISQQRPPLANNLVSVISTPQSTYGIPRPVLLLTSTGQLKMNFPLIPQASPGPQFNQNKSILVLNRTQNQIPTPNTCTKPIVVVSNTKNAKAPIVSVPVTSSLESNKEPMNAHKLLIHAKAGINLKQANTSCVLTNHQPRISSVPILPSTGSTNNAIMDDSRLTPDVVNCVNSGSGNQGNQTQQLEMDASLAENDPNPMFKISAVFSLVADSEPDSVKKKAKRKPIKIGMLKRKRLRNIKCEEDSNSHNVASPNKKFKSELRNVTKFPYCENSKPCSVVLSKITFSTSKSIHMMRLTKFQRKQLKCSRFCRNRAMRDHFSQRQATAININSITEAGEHNAPTRSPTKRKTPKTDIKTSSNICPQNMTNTYSVVTTVDTYRSDAERIRSRQWSNLQNGIFTSTKKYPIVKAATASVENNDTDVSKCEQSTNKSNNLQKDNVAVTTIYPIVKSSTTSVNNNAIIIPKEKVPPTSDSRFYLVQLGDKKILVPVHQPSSQHRAYLLNNSVKASSVDQLGSTPSTGQSINPPFSVKQLKNTLPNSIPATTAISTLISKPDTHTSAPLLHKIKAEPKTFGYSDDPPILERITDIPTIKKEKEELKQEPIHDCAKFEVRQPEDVQAERVRKLKEKLRQQQEALVKIKLERESSRMNLDF